MLGHMSGAYAARVSRDLSLASRFDFNMYSYESEWTMGAEWWLRRAPSTEADEGAEPIPSLVSDPTNTTNDVIGVVKARASTSQVRLPSFGHSSQTLKTFIQNVSLMWEGRLRNMLVSLGVVSDFSSRTKPIKAIGLELSYFSSG